MPRVALDNVVGRLVTLLMLCTSLASWCLQLLKNHHFLLCTLVVWNAAAMEALPIFLDRLADPVTAIILSVTIVLVFGALSSPRTVPNACPPLHVLARPLPPASRMCTSTAICGNTDWKIFACSVMQPYRRHGRACLDTPGIGVVGMYVTEDRAIVW